MYEIIKNSNNQGIITDTYSQGFEVDKDKLLKLVRDNKTKYLSIIEDKIKDYMYRSERYGQKFSLSIGLCNFGVDLRDFESFIRQTDEFIILEDNLCCIILDCAPSCNGIKAANNMLAGFQSRYFSKALYSSVVSSDDFPDKDKLLRELFYVLEYAINNNMDNIVVDSDSMIR